MLCFVGLFLTDFEVHSVAVVLQRRKAVFHIPCFHLIRFFLRSSALAFLFPTDFVVQKHVVVPVVVFHPVHEIHSVFPSFSSTYFALDQQFVVVSFLQVRPLQVNRSVVLSALSTLSSPFVDLFRKMVVFPLLLALPFLDFHSPARPLLSSHVGIFLSDCAVPR